MCFQDLSSQNMYDAGVALNGLSCFITPDLARDLANDIMTLVSDEYILVKYFVKFWQKKIWAAPHENVSSGVCDQARFKPACSVTEAS